MIYIEEGLIATVLASLLILFSIGTSLVAHILLPTIEGNLQKSEVLLDTWAFLKKAGFFGKSSLCGIISLVFLAPGVFAKRGYIDLDEVKRFPLPLKLMLVIPWYGVMIVFFGLACFGYTMGWYA